MGTTLILTPVENLQNEIVAVIKSLQGAGIYVSLNKTKESVEKFLKSAGVSTNNLFFIDCVASESEEMGSIQLKPNELDKIVYSIDTYFKEIAEKKFLIIDSLATLLLYNDSNKVAQLVKKITEYGRKDVEVIALSQKTTTGEELLNKVYNFFDQVKKK